MEKLRLRHVQGFALYRRIGRCLAARGVTIREATKADKLKVQQGIIAVKN
jgi:hypothetical protein